MKVYVFGNKDVPEDKKAIEVAERLEDAIEGVSFVFVGPNADAPLQVKDTRSFSTRSEVYEILVEVVVEQLRKEDRAVLTAGEREPAHDQPVMITVAVRSSG